MTREVPVGYPSLGSFFTPLALLILAAFFYYLLRTIQLVKDWTYLFPSSFNYSSAGSGSPPTPSPPYPSVPPHHHCHDTPPPPPLSTLGVLVSLDHVPFRMACLDVFSGGMAVRRFFFFVASFFKFRGDPFPSSVCKLLDEGPCSSSFFHFGYCFCSLVGGFTTSPCLFLFA